MDTSPQVIKFDEVHGIAGKRCSRGRHVAVARERGVGHTEHRGRQMYESSTHDWLSVRSSRIEGMGRVGFIPPRQQCCVFLWNM